jgi:hypothetical protein
MHVGNDITEESSRAVKRTKNVHGVIEHAEKVFQKYCVWGKNNTVDDSTVGFKGTITKKNPMKWGIRLFVLSDSDNGYVHSIIPDYRNLQVTCVTCHILKNHSLQE